MTFRNGHDTPKDPNVASLDEARRRATEKRKAEACTSDDRGLPTPRDWIIGGAIIAMAVGTIVSVIAKFWPANGGGG